MSSSNAQTIDQNQVVSMHYTLKDDKGNVIDSSEGQEPLTYLHGAGNIIPGLESALVGRKTGDKVQVRVEPQDAYGSPNPELVQTVDRKMFQGVEELEPGMVFQVQASEGQPPQRILVQKVEEDQVTVDGNHPLAGVPLNFDVDIVSLRPASETEVEHGHAH